MQIHRLKLVNFRQHADTEFELGPGLTGIIGPNGAGKTTLLEAIAWALYGNTAARGSKDSIRWTRAPARSQVRVEVDFTLGAHDYRVSRGLHDAQMFQDRGVEPVSSGATEVTGVLTRLLGMTREEFFNTYFTGQKELAVMAALKPAERGRFLSQVLGYERLKTAQDSVREIRKQRRAELDGLQAGLGDHQELVREAEQSEARRAQAAGAVELALAAEEKAAQTVTIARPEWTRVAELKQQAFALDSDRRAAEHQVVDARREHERLDKELAEALIARTRLGELVPQLVDVDRLRSELERLEEESRAAGQRRDLAGQLKEVEKQIERAGARLQEMGDVAALVAARDRELGDARRRLEEAEAEVGRARAAWLQEQEHVRTKRDELREQYKEVKEQRDRIVELGPMGLCPTCGRPLGRDFEQMVGTLNRQLEQIETNGQYFASRVTQLEAPPADLTSGEQARAASAAEVELLTQALADGRARERERADHERDTRTLGGRAEGLRKQIAALPEKYDAERHDQVRDRLRELEPLIRQRERFTVQAERAAALVADMEAAEKRLSERESRVQQLTRAIADLGFSDRLHDAARGAFEAAERALRGAQEDLGARRSDLRVAVRELELATKRLEERARRAGRIEALKAEVLMHDELDAALGEIRTDLNAQMRPELSDIASSLLSDLTDGRFAELELDEGYGIVLVEDGLARPVPSGGEEDVANLALRLAISQLVADRAGQPLSLLVLDEIFGSLDDARREQVVSLLRGLADRFPQVVLITHIESVRDRMDRVLRVRLEEATGAAVVTEDRTSVPGSALTGMAIAGNVSS